MPAQKGEHKGEPERRPTIHILVGAPSDDCPICQAIAAGKVEEARRLIESGVPSSTRG